MRCLPLQFAPIVLILLAAIEHGPSPGTPLPTGAGKLADQSPGGTAESRADFYVAPDGKDTNPGSADAPFATMTRAREAVRRRIARGLRNHVLVLIRGGTYHLDQTLRFGPDDSGTGEFSVTYAAAPGERVVVSGGRAIQGWREGDHHLWTVQLPEVQAGNWSFRQLFVNGRRAVRARTPNADDPLPSWAIRSSQPQGTGPRSSVVLSVDHDIRAWRNASNIEFVWLYNNDGSRKRLGGIDESSQTFTLPPPSQWVPGSFPGDYLIGYPSVGRRGYFENAREFLDEPGEWYLDPTTGLLTYWPRDGEDLARAEVVAPVVEGTLLEVAGARERPVCNLHFRGIELAYLDRPLPPEGYVGMFGCLQLFRRDEPEPSFYYYWIEAALTMSYARGCSFNDGAVAHAGGIGIAIRQGCSAITLEGNRIFDLGGGGIVVGVIRNRDTLKWAEPIAPDEQKGYRIANNHIHDCGADYFGAIGIFLSLTQDSVVSHNEIHDISYAGINVGGNEDKNLKFPMNNVYEYNHIYRVMKTAVDGGGIYVSCTFPPPAGRTGLIRGNWIHDLTRNRFNPREEGPFSCPGIYVDGVIPQIGVKGYVFEGNVVYRAGSEPFHLWRCLAKDQVLKDNVFRVDAPPKEVVEAIRARAGLEEPYRRRLLHRD